MRQSFRKLSTEQELYTLALRALMRRAHSIHQMREYLERRAEDPGQISSVIARLREQKYLDDSRYAIDFARQHAHSRHQGRFRITRELRTRGVPDQHIEAAITAAFAETDEAGMIRVRLKRRLSNLRVPLDERKSASLYRSLLRAGFSADIVRTELRALTRDKLPDVPDQIPSEDV